SQRPRLVRTTLSACGEPNGVVEPSRATTGPKGRLRTATALPLRTYAITCPAGRGRWRGCTLIQPSGGRSSTARPTAVEGASAQAQIATSESDDSAKRGR